MATKTLESGEVIFREGDPSQDAYYILAGKVRVMINTPAGPRILAELGPGEVFGEMGMIEDAPRAATAEAVEGTTIETINEALFEDAILKHPDRLQRYLATLFERLRQSNAALRMETKRRTGGEGEAGLPSSESALVAASEAPTAVVAAGAAAEAVAVRLTARYTDSDWPSSSIDLDLEKFPYRIGRDTRVVKANPFSNNDLLIWDKMPFHISRNHCAIEQRGGRVVVLDRGSTVGTIVNGKPVGVRFDQVVAELKAGDNELILGGEDSPHRFTVTVG